MKHLFVLELDYGLVAVRAELNGAAIARDDRCRHMIRQMKLNPWLVGDSNLFELFLGQANGELPKQEPKTPSCRATVFHFTEDNPGEQKPEDATIADFKWTLEELPPFGQPPKRVWSASFEAPRSFGGWSWQAALPADLTKDSTRSEIISFLSGFHRSLADRDLPRILEALEIRNRENARALGFSEEWGAERIRASFQDLYDSPDWRMDPFVPEAFLLDPSAEGRLVDVTGLGGFAPFRGSAGEKRFELYATLSRIDGRWTMVR